MCGQARLGSRAFFGRTDEGDGGLLSEVRWGPKSKSKDNRQEESQKRRDECVRPYTSKPSDVEFTSESSPA